MRQLIFLKNRTLMTKHFSGSANSYAATTASQQSRPRPTAAPNRKRKPKQQQQGSILQNFILAQKFFNNFFSE
jgi:hypothetical protein